MGKRIKRHTSKSLSIICTDMEISYRRKTFPNLKSVMDVKHRVSCTACGRNLMNELKNGRIFTHPSLEVVLCQSCMDFYGTGMFTTDKSGDDIYCRWCAQGGTIYCCSKCSVAFCKKCIDRNLRTDRKVMADIEKDDWACFICQGKPLWYLRALCWAINKYCKEGTNEQGRKRKISDVSTEDISNKKSKAGPLSAKTKNRVKTEEPTQTSKKPGPASKTLVKNETPKSSATSKPRQSTRTSTPKLEPRQTRHKNIDFSPKISSISSSLVAKDKQIKKRPTFKTTKKVVAKTKKRAVKKQKRARDSDDDESIFESSDEESEASGTELDENSREPIERAVKNTLDILFKLSDQFNSKLLKFGVYRSHLSTSDGVNHICTSLHKDLEKLTRLYTTIDDKMMKYLSDFNEMQEKIEREKAEALKALEASLVEDVTTDINLEDHGITEEDIEEANRSVSVNEEDLIAGQQEGENDKENDDIPDAVVKQEKIDVDKVVSRENENITAEESIESVKDDNNETKEDGDIQRKDDEDNLSKEDTNSGTKAIENDSKDKTEENENEKSDESAGNDLQARIKKILAMNGASVAQVEPLNDASRDKIKNDSNDSQSSTIEQKEINENIANEESKDVSQKERIKNSDEEECPSLDINNDVVSEDAANLSSFKDSHETVSLADSITTDSGYEKNNEDKAKDESVEKTEKILEMITDDVEMKDINDEKSNDKTELDGNGQDVEMKEIDHDKGDEKTEKDVGNPSEVNGAKPVKDGTCSETESAVDAKSDEVVDNATDKSQTSICAPSSNTITPQEEIDQSSDPSNGEVKANKADLDGTEQNGKINETSNEKQSDDIDGLSDISDKSDSFADDQLQNVNKDNKNRVDFGDNSTNGYGMSRYE